MAPAAHADTARNTQWALTDYKASQYVWPKSTGKGVTVAVIDSGVRATHVDLAGQVLPGTDFQFGGNGQTDHSPEFHGTLVASLIAGHGHGPNGEDGIMGLAPGAKILPIGIGPGNAGPGTDYTTKAIRYAVDHGAEVINMSIGGPDNDSVTEAAVAYAEEHNVVLVAAAGNDGISDPQYPASYPGVIKVGAVDKTGKLWSKSDTGGITVVAPGVSVLGDGGDSDTGYRMGDGTSFATAYVSAIAALYRSAHPNLTAGQIVNYIIKTAIPPNGMTTPDASYGYGIASPDLNMAVVPGPAAGPLPQSSPLPSGTSASSGTTTTASGSSSGGSSMGIVLGVLGGLVVLVIIVVVIVRSRRGGGGGNGGAGGGGGQPAYVAQGQQPQAYQPPTGQYGGQSPYGQAPQQNPYGGGNQQYPPQQNPYGNQGR
ncbi:S8 family serine peptidase [Streptacidiphilus neutrinimicus]|uniref:S8 family serine peptidase n=1 Tax=Streptacidiphilus neutrinimicus TaxID=105420 RepID=UPI0006933D35|nr:S8 family serine peptidase [Streptacidiphilus neutrinimicus]